MEWPVDIINAKLPENPTDVIGGKTKRHSARIELPEDYEEIKLFALLMFRFGAPQGLVTFLGKSPDGDPDGPFKWDYLFEPCPDVLFQVLRTANSIEIQWWGEGITKEKVLSYFDWNIGNHSLEVSTAIKSLEQYVLILNPYVRHRKMLEHATEEIQKINIKEWPKISTIVDDERKIKEYTYRYLGNIKEADREAGFSIMIVNESAFMAEAFLNMVVALLIKPEISRVKNLFKEVVSRKWKPKLERLPIDCNYVNGPINIGDISVANAVKLFHTRNCLAHSYPDVDAMSVGNMWFYKRFPVLPLAERYDRFSLALHNQIPSRHQAMECMKYAQDLISFISSHLDHRIRDEFLGVVNSNPLGYNKTKGVYGVPFGDAVCLPVLVGKKRMAG